MSRSVKLEAEYAPLAEAEAGPDTPRREPAPRHRSSRRCGDRGSCFSRSMHAGIVVFELVAGVILTVGFVVLNDARRLQAPSSTLDGLSRLASYNTSMRFENNSRLLADTRQADEYWRRLLDSGGVVSLDTRWALGQGLRASAQSPTDASQSIYQVDVFHALHCLNSMRQGLVSRRPPPWDERHALHCLDYVRHQLLCHPDLTLVRTTDLDEFALDEPHSCRDHRAVLDWVHRHRWVEFPQWLRAKRTEATHSRA